MSEKDEKNEKKPTSLSDEKGVTKPNTTEPSKPKAEPTHEKIEGISSLGTHSPKPPEKPKRAYHKKTKPKRSRTHIEELLGLE